MSKITNESNIDRINDKEAQASYISKFLDQTKRVVNGGLSFADNFDCKILNITFTAANSDTSLTHGLGRVPEGYIVLRLSTNLMVYDGSIAATVNTISLKGSAIGTATLLLF